MDGPGRYLKLVSFVPFRLSRTQPYKIPTNSAFCVEAA